QRSCTTASRTARPDRDREGPMSQTAPRSRQNATALLDWRRQVASLYAQVRQTADAGDAEAAHRIWQAGRNRLLASHSESPVPPERRAGFTGVPVAAYDPARRFTAAVDTVVEPAGIEMMTGNEAVVAMERAGVVRLPGVGDLDVWWLAGYGGGIF